MQKFEKEYLNRKGYLDLRILCPDNVKYLKSKTNNKELGNLSIESRALQSSDLPKWSALSTEEKVEIVKIILANEKQFYQNQASKVWKSPDLISGMFLILMLYTSFIGIPLINFIAPLTIAMPLIAELIVGGLLVALALFGPPILFAGLIIGSSYLLHKLDERSYKKKLVTINLLEKELSSYQANVMSQSIKSSTDVNKPTEEMTSNAANQTGAKNIATNDGKLLGCRNTLFNQCSTEFKYAQIDNPTNNSSLNVR